MSPRDRARQRAAIFTLAFNEPDWLPRWWAYYREHLPADSLFVLDHGTTDGSTDCFLPENREPLANDFYGDTLWIHEQVDRMYRRLFARFEIVAFVATDEFLVHRDGLGYFLDTWDDDQGAVRCTGQDLIKHSSEGPIDPGLPLLAQRGWWHYSWLLSKTLITRKPLEYEPGFHSLKGGDLLPEDPDLVLLHGHRAWWEAAHRRRERIAGRAQNPRDVECGWGFQDRYTGAKLDEWLDQCDREIMPVPDWVSESRI